MGNLGILIDFAMRESTISRRLGVKANVMLSQKAMVRYGLQNQICIPNARRLFKGLCAM